jgi:hypothetical protein
VHGGFIDRVHDLLLCGVDPSLVDLSKCLDHLKSNHKGSDRHVYQETESLLRASSLHWTPSSHTFVYGPNFKASIASVFLAKVQHFASSLSIIL